MILKNQCCFVSLFACLIEQTGFLIQGFFSFHITVNSMISLSVHSLLPLLLFLLDIRLLPEEREDEEGFTIDAILLTATHSWFCTILFEISSMCLCKISFSSSSNPCLPFSVLKENRR